jgi:hypothetical protein
MVHDASDVPGGRRALMRCAWRLTSRGWCDAGLLLCATLADRLGIEELVNESVWLGYGVAGALLSTRTRHAARSRSLPLTRDRRRGDMDRSESWRRPAVGNRLRPSYCRPCQGCRRCRYM